MLVKSEEKQKVFPCKDSTVFVLPTNTMCEMYIVMYQNTIPILWRLSTCAWPTVNNHSDRAQCKHGKYMENTNA